MRTAPRECSREATWRLTALGCRRYHVVKSARIRRGNPLGRIALLFAVGELFCLMGDCTSAQFVGQPEGGVISALRRFLEPLG